jgi:hypothetical protein
MANRILDIVVKVRDAASSTLSKINKQLTNTGKSAKDASLDFTRFNRVLFSATAFLNTFTKAFSSVGSAMEKGAELERVTEQFERVLGPKGLFFDTIRGFTDNTIDRFEAMREGIALKSLGIVQNGNKIAELLAKAGTAGKMAGVSSAEGIKHFSKFLKDGAISHLEFLNIAHTTNKTLQSQLSVLKASGGILGNVIATQHKLAFAQQLLDKVTRNQLKGHRDLLDILQELRQSFMFLKSSVGTFLGTAIAGLLDKISETSNKFTNYLDKVRKTDKSMLELIKRIVVVTGSLASLIGTLGTLRLAVMTLNTLGIGIPQLVIATLALGVAFKNTDEVLKKLSEKLKMFFEFVRGVTQLVSNLDTETGFSKIDKSIHDLLKKGGLLEIAKGLAKIISIVKAVSKDFVDALDFAKNYIFNNFSKVFDLLGLKLESLKAPWKNFWVSDALTPVQKFVRAATVILGGFLAFKGFGILKTLLGKLPIVGRFFGGGGPRAGGPSGTPNDPIYVAVSGIGALFGGLGGIGALGKFGGLLKQFGPTAYLSGGLFGGLSNLIDFAKNPTKFQEELGKRTENYGIGSWLAHPGDLLAATGIGLGEAITNDLGQSIINTMKAGKTAAIMPKMPESNLAQLDIINKQIDLLEGAKKAQFVSAVEEAFKPESEFGSKLSPSEWARIFTYALDTSENISSIVGNTKKTAFEAGTYDRR